MATSACAQPIPVYRPCVLESYITLNAMVQIIQLPRSQDAAYTEFHIFK